MKEYNPKVVNDRLEDCPFHEADFVWEGTCAITGNACVENVLIIPADCPAREGILIKVKE